MPFPIPAPAPTPDPTPGPSPSGNKFYVRDRQGWAVDQERQRHAQALYDVGEYALWVLMWHIQDYQNGLVGRCQTCSGVAGSKQSQIFDVYKQPTRNKCLDCFGTTFEGGYKAQIVRPTIFADTDESETMGARGVTHPDDVDIESTSDFRVRSGDYVFRATGDRFSLRVPQRVTLRTGFATPLQSSEAIGYNHARASIEDPTSVAYLIPPSKDVLRSILGQGAHYPYDFSPYETVRAPLIPAGE